MNGKTIELMRQLLFSTDYVNVAAQLRDASDIKILLDFMLDMLRGGLRSGINLRAREFMFKAITNTPVIPASLFVTGVEMPPHRKITGGGGFRFVYKGKLGNQAVALKPFYKNYYYVVRRKKLPPRRSLINICSNRTPVEKR